MPTTRIEVLKRIPLKDIIPTPDNPRHPLPDDPAVIELAKSIKASGLLQPVVVRHHPDQDGKFDLRCGARRFAAHLHLKTKTILSIVREMDDAEAAEATALENLQRESLSPLQEGQSIAMLLRYRNDAKAIAANIGRSVSWVHRRASLARLRPMWISEFERVGSHIAGWSAGHLELISRLAPDTQERLFDKLDPENRPHLATMGVLELQKHLSNCFFNSLVGAPKSFLETDPACMRCQNCSLTQPDLFGEDQEATCFAPECLKSKRAVWLEEELTKAQAKHGNSLILVTAYGCRPNPLPECVDVDAVLKCWEYDDEDVDNDPDLKPAFVVDSDGSWDPLTKVVVLADRRIRLEAEKAEGGGDEPGGGDDPSRGGRNDTNVKHDAAVSKIENCCQGIADELDKSDEEISATEAMAFLLANMVFTNLEDQGAEFECFSPELLEVIGVDPTEDEDVPDELLIAHRLLLSSDRQVNIIRLAREFIKALFVYQLRQCNWDLMHNRAAGVSAICNVIEEMDLLKEEQTQPYRDAIALVRPDLDR